MYEMTPEEVKAACELRLKRTLEKMAYVPESIKSPDSEIFKAAVDHLMAMYQTGFKDGIKAVSKAEFIEAAQSIGLLKVKK